jgi:hypothetical protein
MHNNGLQRIRGTVRAALVRALADNLRHPPIEKEINLKLFSYGFS